MKRELLKLGVLVAAFLVFFFLPVDIETPDQYSAKLKTQTGGASGQEDAPAIDRPAHVEVGAIIKEYSRNHILTCLVPAFFLAGAIAVFARKEAVLGLLGSATKKWISYPVASVSGGVLAVCSCTILPLFGGIYKQGAGIGPASTFLFAGPAINVAAIFLTGTVLGWELSFVRLGATVASAVIVGLIMAAIFRTHDEKQAAAVMAGGESEYANVPVLLFMGSLLAILVILNLKREIPAAVRYPVSGALLIPVLVVLFKVFRSDDRKMWIAETWDLTKKILPFLLVGVIAAGLIRVFIPDWFVQATLGANRLFSCGVASAFGAVMYFATLTEVPVIQVLMGGGMGKGPALTLFMAGYTLSLPNMFVLVNLMGWKKAGTYILLIMGFSTLAGFMYGNLF